MTLKVDSERYENGGLGYKVVLSEEMASVQDYLDALNDALETLALSRSREEREKCRGCDICCAERIPLTSIDLKVLAQSPAVKEVLKKVGSKEEEVLATMIRRFCHVYVNGNTVDITLRLGEDGKCLFLNRETRTCSLYYFRPFVCQTYICSPASREALELRKAVVNPGEDELVRQWLNYAQKTSLSLWFDEADDPEVALEDWTSDSPFTGKDSYTQVLLKEVLPPGLWSRLK